MRTLLLVLFVFLTANIFAQPNNMKTTTIDVVIYTSSYETSQEKLENFITENQIKVLNQKSSVERFETEFYTTKEVFDKLNEFLPALGYISTKDIGTTNNVNEFEKFKLEIKYLKQQKEAYETELKTMDEKDDRYYQYWEKVREIEHKIFEKKTKLGSYTQNLEYYVELTIYDETVDLTKDRISWVNMPGASFDMLFIETPVTSLSATEYWGYSLRYMFTKGKSYITLGALKDRTGDPSNPDRFSELFVFGIGQDFYTRHFGRGKNRFFNLYTGYNIGGMFATGETRRSTLPYGKLFLGVEIFKNKYILLDNKVGYLVPFKHNRNLRGITYNACFNFVF